MAWAHERSLQVIPFGKGANMIVADGGVRGAIVVRLASEYRLPAQASDDSVTVGGGVGIHSLVDFTHASGLHGLEFAVGIPGTVGGAIRMNAGAYDHDFGERISRVLIASNGRLEWRTRADLAPGHRVTRLSGNEIVVRAELQLAAASVTEVGEEIDAYKARRKQEQPVNIKTFGSVWINPANDSAPNLPARAWELVAAVTERGQRVGGARIHPDHANFIENFANATTDDVIVLMTIVRQRVFECWGYALRPEVVFVGDVALPALI